MDENIFDLCEYFASLHQIPVEYVYMEFGDPHVTDYESMAKVLDTSTLMVYSLLPTHNQ
jgi:hypothetical protein